MYQYIDIVLKSQTAEKVKRKNNFIFRVDLSIQISYNIHIFKRKDEQMKISEIFKTEQIRWTMDEITYPENIESAEKLMKKVKSGVAFDTGWNGLKKEIASFRIHRDHKGDAVSVGVWAAMDDLEDGELLTDADETLTSEDIDNLLYNDDEYAFRLGEIDTEITDESEIGKNPSLQEISDALMKKWNEINAELENGFQTVKEIVSEYKMWKVK